MNKHNKAYILNKGIYSSSLSELDKIDVFKDINVCFSADELKRIELIKNERKEKKLRKCQNVS
jgi:hypothetical protein